MSLHMGDYAIDEVSKVEQVKILVRILANGWGLKFATYMTEGSVGADVEAAVLQPVIIPPNDVALNWFGLQDCNPKGVRSPTTASQRNGTRK